MATILDLINNVKALDFKAIANEITLKHRAEIVKDVKDQLWNGQNPDGSAISPSYLDDPFFKTRKAAEGYAKWKFSGRWGQNTTRSMYTPNLYINGYFYSSLNVKVLAGVFGVDSTWPEVGGKYSKALGLSASHGSEIIEQSIRPEFQQIITQKTGLKFS